MSCVRHAMERKLFVPTPTPGTNYVGEERDPSSQSNLYDIEIEHVHLEWTAHFDTSALTGYVDLTLRVRKPNVTTLVLDTSHLNIASVHLLSTTATVTTTATTTDANSVAPLASATSSTVLGDLPFTLGKTHTAFGSALTIDLQSVSTLLSTTTALAVDARLHVRICYSTTPSSSAIQWLPPAQTAGKQHPYLFTQCQAIHARSMVPIQDSPAHKFTYTARVTVPAPLVALMSARSIAQSDVCNGQVTYEFRQTVPIPSYLLALVIGNLVSRDVGPRSKVWSEPETVEAGAFEFAETEQFISAAESIVGPYVWGHYDILLLPPSFPYGGMENPCLTFVTPTLLAGDRSLATVVAHEIAHSWFGNFVTSHTWEHFWMNEGFTVFLERKILQAMKDKKHMHLDALVGWRDLQKSVDLFGADHPYTVLNVKLDGVDPDDAFSSVPYEKGFNFLFYLERLVGGEDIMNPFLQAYCQRYRYATVSTQEFQRFFVDYFTPKVAADVLASIDWDTWLHKPGMPPKPELDLTLADSAHELATAWVKQRGGDAAKPQVDVSSWSCDQIVVFLEKVQEYQAEAEDKAAFRSTLEALDAAYHFTASRNSEIRFKWLTLSIHSQYEAAFPAVVAFLIEQGRMKFIRPLYRDLYRVGGESGKKLAVDTFRAHHTMYHSIAQKMVARDLEMAL